MLIDAGGVCKITDFGMAAALAGADGDSDYSSYVKVSRRLTSVPCTLASHLSRCTHLGWCEIASPRSRRGLCCQRYAPTSDTFSDYPSEIRVLSHVGIADAYRDAGALGSDGSADQ